MNRRTKQTINYNYKICDHLLALESLLNAREFFITKFFMFVSNLYVFQPYVYVRPCTKYPTHAKPKNLIKQQKTMRILFVRIHRIKIDKYSGKSNLDRADLLLLNSCISWCIFCVTITDALDHIS
ncbi:hypothetical protein BpHYR1_053950 [Brachionus plicatilis]|uniref:Uncharacterized protein n=1 Tax=Brachionus plicatilis TaxID=10195 RepID=A0A3M7SSK5_BRAPC|nr:hypothetical protein BpHYR1_053950 [Brachionus plicatilis]